MKITKNINQFIREHIEVQTLIIILFILGAVYLVMLTASLWLFLLTIVRRILFPFMIGFIFAYLIYPITVYLERFKLPRAASLVIVLTLVLSLLVLLFAAIIPNLVDDLTLFAQNIVESVQGLYSFYIQTNPEPSDVIMGIYTELVNIVSSVSKQIPAYITGLITSTLSILTTILFAFVVGIYFLLDYERVVGTIGKISRRINIKLYRSLKVIDRAVKGFVRTELIIMLITFVEYTVLYTLIGHNYALILGLLTALSMLVPYIGPTVVHGIGILTSFNLGFTQTIILTVLLLVLSQVDGYVITPMVFNKRDKLKPLWSLFSFFACSVIFGFVGILMSMPLYFSVNAVLRLRANNWNDPLETK